MLELDAYEFVEVINVLQRQEHHFRDKKGDIPSADLERKNDSVRETVKRLQKLELPVSVRATDPCVGATTNEEYHKAVEQLQNVIVFELDGRKFYGPLNQYAKYYDQDELFGADVFAAFPSANDDISEAGTCLAFERGTASVMHLMRALEAGLAALAKAVDVSPQNDWGAYLRKIDTELETRQKASGSRTADEQFYAEVSTHLGHMRVAWRNPTMHVEKSYSPDRAGAILVSVRAFMKHLATKISENP